jgi:hypothetical protein
VNPSKYHVGSPIARYLANFVAAKSVRGVDANADNIAGFNVVWVRRFQRFIH